MLNLPSAQEIFLYKSNTANFLKSKNLVDSRFFVTPVSGGKHQPDLILTHKSKEASCELKISPNVFGRLELSYYDSQTQHPWKFKPFKLTEDEKAFAKDIAISPDVDIFKRIKREWKEEEPAKKGIVSKAKGFAMKQILKRVPFAELFKREKKTFSDIKGTVNPSRIEAYYNRVNVYYINFGTHGFYRLGDKNPLELKDVPLFRDSAKIEYLVTVEKKRGYDDYDFVFYLSFEMTKTSPYNIGPVHGGKSVTILRDRVNLDCFKS